MTDRSPSHPISPHTAAMSTYPSLHHHIQRLRELHHLFPTQVLPFLFLQELFLLQASNYLLYTIYIDPTEILDDQVFLCFILRLRTHTSQTPTLRLTPSLLDLPTRMALLLQSTKLQVPATIHYTGKANNQDMTLDIAISLLGLRS
jgi:hypothetical protein